MNELAVLQAPGGWDLAALALSVEGPVEVGREVLLNLVLAGQRPAEKIRVYFNRQPGPHAGVHWLGGKPSLVRMKRLRRWAKLSGSGRPSAVRASLNPGTSLSIK